MSINLKFVMNDERKNKTVEKLVKKTEGKIIFSSIKVCFFTA